MRRKDEVDRKTISAHVDRRLVDYLDDRRLSKSEWVEKGLRLVLEQTMTDDELAYKLKIEADRERERIAESQKRLEEIDQRAKQTFGTTLDEYFDLHDPKPKRESWIDDFNEGWLKDYLNNGNTDPRNKTAEHIATHVFDVIIEKNYGFTGHTAIEFVKDAIKRIKG